MLVDLKVDDILIDVFEIEDVVISLDDYFKNFDVI